MISIILPTYNEKSNIGYMIKEINKQVSCQIIVVDDNSPDGTGRIADELSQVYNLKVIHRPKKNGLGTAIAEGFSQADGEIVGVMDADRSHPPEVLPELINPIRDGKADMVIGSRNMRRDAKDWPLSRELISWGATVMARLLVDVKDPLSGYFFLRRDVIEQINFMTKGYKIGMEIIVKGRYNNILEVPYAFQNRQKGSSKLNWTEHINYIRDWFGLFYFRTPFSQESPRQ